MLKVLWLLCKYLWTKCHLKKSKALRKTLHYSRHTKNVSPIWTHSLAAQPKQTAYLYSGYNEWIKPEKRALKQINPNLWLWLFVSLFMKKTHINHKLWSKANKNPTSRVQTLHNICVCWIQLGALYNTHKQSGEQREDLRTPLPSENIRTGWVSSLWITPLFAGRLTLQWTKSLIHGKKGTVSVGRCFISSPRQAQPIGRPFIPHVQPWLRLLGLQSKTSQTHKIKILRAA